MFSRIKDYLCRRNTLFKGSEGTFSINIRQNPQRNLRISLNNKLEYVIMLSNSCKSSKSAVKLLKNSINNGELKFFDNSNDKDNNVDEGMFKCFYEKKLRIKGGRVITYGVYFKGKTLKHVIFVLIGVSTNLIPGLPNGKKVWYLKQVNPALTLQGGGHNGGKTKRSTKRPTT